MPTLEELKEKWFLDVSLTGRFPPQTRPPETQVQCCTDGNLVTPLIDGSEIMADFRTRLNNMINSVNPSQHELWIASWRLDPVKLLGATNPAKDAETKILEAADADVKVYYLGSGHVALDDKAQEFARKLKEKGSDGTSDKRFPVWGSHHQKFNIFRGPGNDWVAVLGSADLSYTRWDTPCHLADNPDRPNECGFFFSDQCGPTHDVAVSIRGPAVHDIALTFVERWNDITSIIRSEPGVITHIPTTFLSTPIPPTAGTHSVQVLRTYPIEPDRGYPWSDQGEFTIWAAYLKAIKKATQYIYIEDQYFYTFNDPPAINAPEGKMRDSDIVYQLGERIRHGVDVIVLVPSRSEDFGASYQLHQRGKAAEYLDDISVSNPGRFLILSLNVGEKDPVVHSKLMIVDDEFVLIGCANICQRSMSHDSEIHLGIVDSANMFARQLRLALWQEHLELTDPSTIINPSDAISEFINERGRVRLHSTHVPLVPILHGTIMNHIIDPYGGPDRR